MENIANMTASEEIEDSSVLSESFDLSRTGSNVTSKSDEHSDISYSTKSSQESTPPPNVAEGGVWGTAKIRPGAPKGCSFLMIGCAQERKTYAVWGRNRDRKGNEVGKRDILLYDTEGNLLGPRKNFRWIPKRNNA